MNSNEILKALTCLFKNFNINYHVTAANELMNLSFDLLHPTLVICNVDPSWLPGSHWVSVFIDRKKDICEFFDSYGNSYVLYGKYFSFLSYFNPVINSNTLQAPNSNICGQYCLVYAYYKKNNLTLNEMLKTIKFTGDRFKNDLVVKKKYNLHIHDSCFRYVDKNCQRCEKFSKNKQFYS